VGTSERASGVGRSGERAGAVPARPGQPLSDPSLVRFRALIEVGLVALEARREEVNALNADPANGPGTGDTGDNMVLTLRAVVSELDRLEGASEGHTIDEIGRDEIVASVARAALLGARGNSGVILSQLIRGAAEELASRPGELIDPLLIGSALARASDQAYGSVREPAEGTMLTVVRELAGRVASELAHRPDARLTPETTALEQDLMIADVIRSSLGFGGGSGGAPGPGTGLPALDDVLAMVRDSHTFDAGGYGLIVLLAGIVAALQGGAEAVGADAGAAELGSDDARWSAVAHRAQHMSVTYRYCTNFAVTGQALEPRRFVGALEAIGDAVLVVGDATTLKVHVHTDDPERAIAAFDAAGEVSHREVIDMAAPGHEAVAHVSALIALVDGEGLRELYAGLGAYLAAASAGPYDLLAAIDGLDAREIVILPNRPEAIADAERVAELADRVVAIVPSVAPQAGLAAAALHATGLSAHDNAAAMTAALARIRTGTVGPAATDDPDGRYAAGDAIAMLDDHLVAWGAPGPVLRDALARLAAGAEMVSALRGADAPLDDAEVERLAPGGVPLTQSVGGQPDAWWLLTAQ
jgi:dihydroxyacetone kinase-like predicted kinase